MAKSLHQVISSRRTLIDRSCGSCRKCGAYYLLSEELPLVWLPICHACTLMEIQQGFLATHSNTEHGCGVADGRSHAVARDEL